MSARIPVVHALQKALEIVLILACGAAAQAATAEPLTVAVSRSPLSLPFYVAQSEGFFAAEGLSVDFLPCVGGHRCMRQVIEGKASFATVSDVPIALNAFVSDNWSIVATFVSSYDDVKVIVRKSSGVQIPAQLAGKRVGVVAASSSQYYLESYLLTNQVDPASVRAVALQPEQLNKAFTEGNVDAIAAWEPFGYAALQSMKGSAFALPNNLAYRETFNLIVQRRLVKVADPEIAKVLAALERAQALIREHPSRAQAILRAALDVEQPFVDWIWPQLQYRLSLDQGLLKTLESEARWALREGHVVDKRPPNFLPYIHAAPLLSVKPDLVGIAR